MRKTFKNYELMLGEIVTYYQLIERDLKLIYLFLFSFRNRTRYTIKDLNFKGLGEVINALEILDLKTRRPYFASEDYELLKLLASKRNYYCHYSIMKFAYIDDFEKSEKFINSFNELYIDVKKLDNYRKQIENIRIKLERKIENNRS